MGKIKFFSLKKKNSPKNMIVIQQRIEFEFKQSKRLQYPIKPQTKKLN
jgi:hypothetical protein